MTLPSSGSISLSQVRTELNAGGAISLGQASVRNLAGVPSGAISLSQLRGKSNIMFTPAGGAVSASNQEFVSVTLRCTVPAVWTYTRNSGTLETSSSPASGSTSTSVTFSVSAHNVKNDIWTNGSGSWTVTASAGGISTSYTVTLTAFAP